MSWPHQPDVDKFISTRHDADVKNLVAAFVRSENDDLFCFGLQRKRQIIRKNCCQAIHIFFTCDGIDLMHDSEHATEVNTQDVPSG